ncbi:hypothetical protein N7488_005165 [Penicillium malachiteum]|nr:hypothetical protein N7488_005165 [Penicillium malachiteum]
MGGLRALCCSKGDKNDEDHDTPARPAQPAQLPEKNTQNAPTNIAKESSLTGMSEEKPEDKSHEEPEANPKNNPPRDLWKEAYETLDPKLQKHVPASNIPATDAIQVVSYILMQWLASSAWTIVSFGMSIVQNRLDRRDAVFAASEFLTETMAWFAIIDAEYRNQGTKTDANMDQALVRVYSAILTFAAEVRQAGTENEAERSWNSIFAFTDQPLASLKTTVIEQKAAANEWAHLAANLGKAQANAALSVEKRDLFNLGDRERAKTILVKTDEVLELSRDMDSRILSTSFTIRAEEDTQVQWMSSINYSARQRWLEKRQTGDTAGCGKSVLCSTVNHDLQELCDSDPAKCLGYWYFQFDAFKTRRVDNMVRSLIRQLSRTPLAPSIKSLWNKHHIKGDEPSSEAIMDVLDHVLVKASEMSHIYLVFDGFDECPDEEYDSQRESLLSFLVSLLERHSDKVHILATSRPEKDITDALEKFPRVDLQAHLAEDLKTFVDTALPRGQLGTWDAGTKKMISDKLLNLEERRFRWAELQIESLGKQVKKNDLLNALQSVPKTLEGTYRQVLDGIEEQNISTAQDIFMMICLSSISLNLATVAKMMDICFPEDVIKICTSSLVTLLDMVVQVAHFFVQEYLIIDEEKEKKMTKKKGVNHHECQFTTTDGHKRLTEMAIDCLLAQSESSLTETEAIDLPQFLYSSRYWVDHMVAAGGSDQMSPGVQVKINALFTEPTVYHNWVRAADSKVKLNDNEGSKLPAECEFPIHRASYMGLIKVVEHLSAQGADPLLTCKAPDHSLYDYEHLNSLATAAHAGHLDILQFFLTQSLPLDKRLVRNILRWIDHRKSGTVKLKEVLETFLNQGLLCHRSPITGETIDEPLIERPLDNEHTRVEIFRIFLDWPTVTIPITESTSNEILLESKSSDLLKLLYERCDMHVPKRFMTALVEGRLEQTAGLAYFVLERQNELPMSKHIVEAFARYEAAEKMESLLQSRRDESKSRPTGPEVIAYLVQISETPLPFTEEVLLTPYEAIENEKDRAKIIAALVPHAPNDVFTDKVFEEAFTNKAIMVTLLDQERRAPPTEKILDEIASWAVSDDQQLGASGVLQVLLERNLVTADENLVELMAGLFQCVDVLLSFKPDAPITNAALLKAASDARVMRVIMTRNESVTVTDEVLTEAVTSSDPIETLKVILNRQGTLHITEELILAACENRRGVAAKWLLLQQSQSFVRNSGKIHGSLLVGFAGSIIT